MTYPVDDAGNPRVDFVWGNFPLQPNDQRDTYNTGNQTNDGNWTNFPTVGSEILTAGWDVLSFPTGDGGNYRQQTFTWDNHEIAESNYEGYPSFIQGVPYDDTIPNVAMPNIVGLTQAAALTAISNAGLTTGGTNSSTGVGATSGNTGKVKSQNPAPGTLVNVNEDFTWVIYSYTGPATTGPIDTLVNPLDVNLTEATDAWMYLIGRTVKPTVGDFINIDGSTQNMYNNNNFEVISVANDDSFNTGGTKVKIRSTTGNLGSTNLTATGGTWTKL